MKTGVQSKKIRNRIVFMIICIIIIGIIAFGIYVSTYYHAQKYDITGVSITETKHYITYGNETAKAGFIFYPGAKVEEKAYEPILSELAKKDIYCVLVKMPFHLAVFQPNAAEKIIEEKTQIKEWYLGGHSLGGAMAAEFVSSHQKELQGLILLAAYPTKELEQIPVLSIYGSNDTVLNKEKYTSSITFSSHLTEVIIEGGNHAQFGNYGEQKKDGKAKISAQEQWQQTIHAILDFIAG